MREVIRYAVEKALLEMGPPELAKVEQKLLQEFNCKIEDCFDHPDYLKSVLLDLFGYSYDDIYNSIIETLKYGTIDQQLLNFINILER